LPTALDNVKWHSLTLPEEVSMAYNQPTAVAVSSDMHSHTGVSQNQIMTDNKYK